MHPGGVPLEEYRRKRDARTTPEPFGGRAGREPIFVVQRHAARSLHLNPMLVHEWQKHRAVQVLGIAGGWAMMSAAELLSVMPEDQPERERVLTIFRRGAQGVAAWHIVNPRTVM